MRGVPPVREPGWGSSLTQGLRAPPRHAKTGRVGGPGRGLNYVAPIRLVRVARGLPLRLRSGLRLTRAGSAGLGVWVGRDGVGAIEKSRFLGAEARSE